MGDTPTVTIPDNFTTYFGSTAHGLFVNWKSSADTATYEGTTEIEMAFTANLRSKLHVFIDSGADTADVATDYTDQGDLVIDYESVAGSAGTEYDGEFFTFQYYVAWQNPDSASGITYDGVQGRVNAKVTSGDRTDLTTTKPTISAIWEYREDWTDGDGVA